MPITNEPNATNVEGIEKNLSSLKIETTIMEKIIPIINKIKPGIPRNLNGWLIAINSIIDVITPAECVIGSLVEVLPWVLYNTVILSSEIFNIDFFYFHIRFLPFLFKPFNNVI